MNANIGDKKFVIIFESPDASNNAHIIKIAAIYGRMARVNCTLLCMPWAKLSYILTFFATAKPNTKIKTIGIIAAIVYLPPKTCHNPAKLK